MKKLLVITFLFLSYQCRSQGNMITINSTVPTQMTICGVPKGFTITIYNPSPFTLSNDTLKLTMPPGIAYQAGSVMGASQGNITIPNAPVFVLPNIPTLSSLSISFIAAVGCDIMAYTSGGGIIENKIRIDYTANNVQNFDIHTTSSYIVRQPNLSIVNVSNQSYTGNIGDVFTRCISITNGGLGELSQFTLTDTHGSGLQITAVNKGTWTNAGTLETIVLGGSDFSGIGDGDALFENGENIIICETVNVLNCISVASTIEAYWGCNGQNCQSFTSSANVVFPNLIPNLIVTPNSGNIYAVMNSCIGQATQQELKIENTGLGQATNVHLDIFQSTGAGYQNYLGSSIDETSFTIQVGASPPVIINTDSAKTTSPLSCMAATAKGRVFLSIPAVNPGEIIYIRWNTYSCCYNACTGVGQNYFNGWRYAGNYSNVCQSPYVITENWGRVYSQMYGALNNNSSVSTLSNGETGTFNFVFSNYGNHYSYPVSPSAYWKMVFTLPPCLVYSGNLHILSYNGVDTWIPASVSTSGNVLTAIFSGSAPFGLDHAEIIIDLTVDCSGCTGAAGAVGITAYYVPDASCSCEVAIACQSASISVLCPGVCPEGMVFRYFDIVRSSYGQPDNEPGGGDGIPDVSGSLNFSKIKTNRAMFGDTITATFKGKVVTSINHPTWQYCYAYSSISNGNTLGFLDARLTIYRGGSLIATCTNFTPVISTSGTTRNFLFDLSAPTLIPGGCLPGGFVYLNNDSVVFKPRYKVIVNTGGPILNCYSSNEYYVSDIANPTAGDKYQCSQYNGNCSVVGYYFTTSGADSYSVKSCDNVIIYQNYYLSIGPCCSNYQGGNLFPYEYRNWAHIDTLTAIVPPGYDYISAQFIEYRTAGTLNYVVSSPTVLSPVNPNSNSLVFPVEQYFQGYNGLLPLSDDGFVGTLSVTLKPSCEVSPTISQDIKYDWTFKPTSYLTGPGAYPTFLSYVQDHIIYQAPVLFLQSSLPSVQAPNNTTSWDISISNTSNVSNGLNTWLSGPAISGLTIIRMYDLDNNVTIPLTGSIYRVGTINAATVRNFRITATFTSCFQDSIIVYSGWNCNGGYPTSITDYPCSPEEITLKSSPLMPLLVVNVTGPSSTIQLCDTASYTIEGLNVQLGTAYDLTLTATLPIGVTIIPGSSKFNYPISGPYTGIPDPVFLGGTMWQWDISAINLQLDTSGLKGILESALNSFNITFKVTTNCGYTSGSVIGFNLVGQSACGLPTGQDVALSSQLGITGATAPYTTLINLVSTYISPCANNSNMKVVVHNTGPLAFGNVDSVIVQLPPGVSFIAGSFAGIYNAPGNGIPKQYSLNGNSYLIWQLPSGTASGDSSVFSFDYKGDAEVLSCDISEFGAQTISSTNVTCTLTGSSCPISIITGDTTLAVYTYKAYLSLSNGMATSIPNPAAGERVTMNLDIINVGQAILSGANSIIQFYYDANGNGIYNPSDVFIAQDTLMVNNNNTIPYSHTFNVPAGQACAIIAIIDTSANPCVCNPSQLLVQPLLISLGNDTALCSGETLLLSSPAVTGYTYSWTPATDLNNTTTSSALLTSSNITTDLVSTTYILTTDRMGCISKDTIEITVNPVPVSNAGTDIVTCSINTPGSIGTPSNTGYTYLWSPTIGLSDATLSNPAVSLVTSGTTAYIVTTTSFGCVSKDTVVVRVNPLPTATIAGAIAICKGATAPKITFTGANGTAPYIFTYTLNAGPNQTISTTNGDTVSIAAPTTVVGTFIYSLVSVQDASSTTCSQAQNGSATITVTSLPTATIAGTTAVCKNAAAPNITFTGASGTAPYTFIYTINGGANQTISTTIGNSVDVLVPATAVGTFIYALASVQDGNTCSQVQAGNATITVDPLPVANFGFEDICLNQGMYFYDSSTVASGTVTAWSWDLGDSGPLDAAQNPVYIYANKGSYNVSLISTTNNGCKDTISKSVVVHPLPAVQFFITPVSIGVCDDSTVQFNDASTIVAPDVLQSWTWNFGDGSPLHTSQLVTGGHVYGGIGSYNVQLTVVSDFGCSDSLSKPITINPNPVVNFSGSPASGCEPLCISFSDSSSLALGSNVHWTWDLGDGSPLSNSQIFEHCYTNDSVFAPNYFTITLTVTSDSGCVSTLSKNNNITVYPNPQADFFVAPETTSVVDPVISFINLSTGADFWNWNFGDLNTSQVSSPSPHRYAADVATYVIALTTTTQYGCTDTAYKTIVIDPDFVFYIPNSFTPNEDGGNDYFFGTGIGIIKYDLWIFDRWGNMVFHGDEVPAENAKWDGRVNHGKAEAQMDVYVWKVTLTDVFSKVHKYIGTVTIVR